MEGNFIIAQRRAVFITAVMGAALIVVLSTARAQHSEGHHQFLGGPWELVVQVGLEGEQESFPITVLDENKPQHLDQDLPLAESSIELKLRHYLPNLVWEDEAVEQPGAGSVARVTITGQALEKTLYLISDDPERQTINVTVGMVSLQELNDPNSLDQIAQQLTDPKCIGVLSVPVANRKVPLEYAITEAQEITLPDGSARLEVLQYIPHYTIDLKTKEVVSLSDEPRNPAIRLQIADGTQTRQQWLWARFPSFAHDQHKTSRSEGLPYSYVHFNLTGPVKRYIILTAPPADPWLLEGDQKKNKAEKLVVGKAHAFNDDYQFTVDKIQSGVVIEKRWKNKSDTLLRPAVVLSFEQEQTRKEMVLELGEPLHMKTKTSTMVLMFRNRQPETGPVDDS